MTAQLPSRERLEGIARGEKCCTRDDVVQVVRALLAAHEQEPVAYKATHLDSFAFGETKSAVEEHAERFGWELEFTEITPLYTHPAPSIPAAEETNSRALFESWFREEIIAKPDFVFADFDNETGEYIPPDDDSIELYTHIQAMLASWNACRAAMLNGGKS